MQEEKAKASEQNNHEILVHTIIEQLVGAHEQLVGAHEQLNQQFNEQVALFEATHPHSPTPSPTSELIVTNIGIHREPVLSQIHHVPIVLTCTRFLEQTIPV
jgi:hypothetical protein